MNFVLTEITKDSSGSFSTSENFSDEEQLSSLSGRGSGYQVSPTTPDRQYYEVNDKGKHGSQPPMSLSKGGHALPPSVSPGQSPTAVDRSLPGANKYSADMDLRDGYREDGVGDHAPGSARGSAPSSARDRNKGGEESLESSRVQSARSERGDRPVSGRPGPAVDRPYSGRSNDSGRPHSSKSNTPSHHGKRRDYFENNDTERSDSDGYKTPQYDDNTYSSLNDNNAVTSRRIRDDIPDSDLIDYEDDGGSSLVDSVPDLEYDETKVRIFIALFDYDPMLMSPNPDAADEELPFKEGQLVKVRTIPLKTSSFPELIRHVYSILYRLWGIIIVNSLCPLTLLGQLPL